MEVKDLVKKYLPTVNIMQLATSKNDQPWACTVHFYSDEDCNLYWLSSENRRHSREVKDNDKVAAAIVVHENTPEENYVIGISVEGVAEFLDSNISDKDWRGVVKKLGHRQELIQEIRDGKNKHKFYRIKPTNIVLFDNKDFPDNPRQEWSVTK